MSGSVALHPPIQEALRAVPATSVRAGKPHRWWIVALLIVLAAILAGAEAWRHARNAATVRYTTALVTRGAVTRMVTASGSVNPVITIQVGTYVSGVIQELYCDYNTVVRRGQLCAKIDPRPYQTAVDQDMANLATAKSQLVKDETTLVYARLTYDRTADLSRQGIATQDSLDSAKAAYDAAKAQIELDQAVVRQHQAALDAAKINLDYTNIVSPVDGTVVSRNVTMGQTVAASFQTPTLFLIATDLTKMQVDADASESDIGGVKEGDRATFSVDAYPNHPFTGVVTQVRQAPQTVQNVVTYDVVVSVANRDLLLKPGMTATVKIVVARRDDVLRIPDQALRYVPGGLPMTATSQGPARAARSSLQVWVLRGGRPVAVPIAAGLDDDTYSEVIRGPLGAGDQVVIAEQRSTGSGTSRPMMFR